MNARKLIVSVHGWLGLFAGVLLSLMGLSGSALIFRPQIEPRLEARLLRVEPQGRTASWQAVYESVRRALPPEKVQHIFVSRMPDRSHEIWLRDGDLLAYVDPYTAKVLGTRVPQRDVFGWLAQLHIRLLSGEIGHNVIGIGGLLMIVMSLSGIVLWWPRKNGWRRALVPCWNTNWKGRNYELHRVGGALACGILMLSALTGMSLVWAEWVGSALGRVFGDEAKAKVQASAGGKWRSLDELVRRANAAFPDGRLTRISFPQKPGAPLVIRKKLPDEMHPNGMNSVTLDPVNGRVLAITDSREARKAARLMNLRYPLHIGEWGGMFSKVLYALVGLTPFGLFISGAIMWGLRKWRKRARSSRPASV